MNTSEVRNSVGTTFVARVGLRPSDAAVLRPDAFEGVVRDAATREFPGAVEVAIDRETPPAESHGVLVAFPWSGRRLCGSVRVAEQSTGLDLVTTILLPWDTEKDSKLVAFADEVPALLSPLIASLAIGRRGLIWFRRRSVERSARLVISRFARSISQAIAA